MFIVDKYKDLQEYVPGEQPKAGTYIKLNTNESPYSPPACAKEQVFDAMMSTKIYNDTECKELAEVFAKKYNVSTENLLFANGSDEILYFCFMAFCDEKIGACFPDITYGFYRVYSKFFCTPFEEIPLTDDYKINHTEYFNKGKTIIITNPNAPTGIVMPLENIEEIVKNNPKNVVIVDEAYIDFGGESAISLIDKYPNILVCGTFSKSRNMAGARLGYAIASKSLIAEVNKIKFSLNPYNVNSMTQVLGKISIEQDEYFKECIEKIITAREKFTKDLADLGFDTIKSNTNFVFTKHKNISGEELYKKLKERFILVRFFNTERTKDFVRISIGTKEDMDTVVKNIKEILEEKNA